MQKFIFLVVMIVSLFARADGTSRLHAPNYGEKPTPAQLEQAGFVLNEFNDIISAARSVYFGGIVGANTVTTLAIQPNLAIC
jgi:hypothetical protein